MPYIALSPVFSSGTQFNNLGKPLSGGKLFAYIAGSNSTLKITYSNNSGTPVANPNPIVLDSTGRLGTSIWLEQGETYHLVLTMPDGTTVLETQDYVQGAITEDYLNARLATLNGVYLPLTGGTVTGNLTVLGTTSVKNTSVVGTLNVSGLATLGSIAVGSITSVFDASSQKITNVATPTATTDAANKAYVDASGTDYSLPPGVIVWSARNAAPTGWLFADGDSVSRTTYAALYAAIGTTYGSVDSGTFNLPDLRGTFIRGFDAGRGFDSGRVFGSNQNDEIKSHLHTDIILSGSNKDNGDPAPYVVTNGEELNGTRVMTDSATGLTGGSETRPKNIALVAIIKY